MAEEAVTAGGDPLVRAEGGPLASGPLVRGRCPRCRKAIEWKGNIYRPFCSDRRWPFGQWIDEEYRIASENHPSKADGEGRG